MRTLSTIAAAFLVAACFAAPAYAKPAPVVVQIAYIFKTPKGGEKVWIDQLQLNGAAAAEKFCAADVQKSAKDAKYFTENYRELIGHTFVSASCVMKSGTIKMSNKPFSAWRIPDPAAVGFYFKDKAGKIKTTMIYNQLAAMGMSQCRQEIRGVTSQFKNKIPKTIEEFSGMTFVKSECVFVEDFKL